MFRPRTVVQLAELGLATWRLSRMLVRETGPLHLFAGLRERTGILYDDRGRLVSWPDWNPLHCVYCTTVWASALLVLVVPRIAVQALAVSGVAVVVEEVMVTLLQEPRDGRV